MKDLFPYLDAWQGAGEAIAVATVVETWGSAPRPVGSKLIATGSGGFTGSVSAGCVEGAVIEECAAVIRSGATRLLKYGVADDTAWDVGLACGGTIRILVEPFAAWQGVYEDLHRRLDAREPLAIVSVLPGPAAPGGRLVVRPDGSAEGDLELQDERQAAVAAALAQLAFGQGVVVPLTEDLTLFVEVYPKVKRLIVVGAVHIADPLLGMATLAGFDTLVVDPRPAFATRERFPQASRVIQGWPDDVLPGLGLDETAFVVVLTHDPKVDDPALRVALPSAAAYVGALGSKRTNRLRLERLREAGLSETDLARLHAPVGLDLGGKSPGEIAVSILAQVVQVCNRSRSAA